MKIGLTCHSGVGGSGILATELGKHLARRGHEVHFITSSPPVRLGDFYETNIFFHEAEILEYPVLKESPYVISLAAKMAEVARSAKLDLLHVHYAIPHAASAYLARQMLKSDRPIKFITTLHGTDVTLVGSQPGFLPLTRFCIDESDGITAVSEHLKEITYDIFDIKSNIEVIYNFVDTNHFRPEKDLNLRRRFAPDDHKILIHMSNFRPVKKVLNTIRVFDIIRKEIPATLLMVGEGTDYYAANRLVESLGLEGTVKFLGTRECVEKLLPAADLFIINSIKESFGLAVLEAAACGVPAVATDIGGLPEVVINGVTGCVSPADDVEDMAENAIKILSNPDLLLKMSRSARKRAVEAFDSEIIIPKYEEYYEKIVRMP